MAQDREYVGIWEDATPKSVSVTCGWCARDVEMKRISRSVELARTEYHMTSVVVTVAAAYLCPRHECHRPSLVFLDFYEELGETWAQQVIGQLPRGTAGPMQGLPEEIDDVRREAWGDYYGGAYRSSVVMARAAVQRAVRTLLPEKERDLYTEIEKLREAGVITEELKEWAHDVRLAAREAAHPEELGAVGREEAEESLRFADAFLEFAVALPALREARKAAAGGAQDEASLDKQSGYSTP